MARTRSFTGWDLLAVAGAAVGVLALSMTSNGQTAKYPGDAARGIQASAPTLSEHGWHWPELAIGGFIVLAVTVLLLVKDVVKPMGRVVTSGWEGGLIGIAALAFFLQVNRALTFPNRAASTTDYSIKLGGWLVLGGSLVAILASLLSWAVHRGAFRRDGVGAATDVSEDLTAPRGVDVREPVAAGRILDLGDGHSGEPEDIALDLREHQGERSR